MSELDNQIKEFNLFSTDTVNSDNFSKVALNKVEGKCAGKTIEYYNVDISKVEAKYDESISLLDLVSSFNRLYLLFKKDYDELEKIRFGKTIIFSSFGKYTDRYKPNFKDLNLFIGDPFFKINGKRKVGAFLCLREVDGKYMALIDGKYLLNLREDSIKKYVDLFDKHSQLLDMLQYLKRKVLLISPIMGPTYPYWSDKSFCMKSAIDDGLLCNLNKFVIELNIDSTVSDNSNSFILPINLGENFGMDYENCKHILTEFFVSRQTLMKKVDDIPTDNKDYDDVLRKVYVNKKFLKRRDYN